MKGGREEENKRKKRELKNKKYIWDHFRTPTNLIFK